MALSLPKAGVFAEAHARVVAHQIAAKILARAPSQRFDGKGYCCLETGGERAVRAEGSFFEVPHPVMQNRSPDEAQFRDGWTGSRGTSTRSVDRCAHRTQSPRAPVSLITLIHFGNGASSLRAALW